MSRLAVALPRNSIAPVATVLAAIAIVSFSAWLSLTAVTEAAPYAAEYVNECCFGETIESGAVEPEYFTLTNVGSETWGVQGGPSINIGTEEPQNHQSPFESNWPSNGRPVVGTTHPVPPASSYKFIFTVKAPVVSSPTTLTENYGLLAELVTWIDASSGLGPGLSLPFKVVPAQPPSITLSSYPTSLEQGASFTVAATASAVAAVNHVTVHFAGQEFSSGPVRNPEIVDDEQSSWTASAPLTAANVGLGPQTIVATAYDDAGLTATTTAVVAIEPHSVVQPPPAAVVPPVRMYFAGHTTGSGSSLSLTRIVILGARKGERIVLLCRHCSGGRRLGPRTAKGSEVTFKPAQLSVKARSTLEVYATQKGVDGRFKLYSLHPGSASSTLRRQGCLAPASAKVTACPH